MKTLLAIICAALAGGCATGFDPEAAAKYKPVQLSDEEASRIQAAVRNRLKDPDSARFRTFAASSDGDLTAVCGMVNSRNSFGGYAGDAPFNAIIQNKTGNIQINRIGGSEFERRLTYNGCSNYNVPSDWLDPSL